MLQNLGGRIKPCFLPYQSYFFFISTIHWVVNLISTLCANNSPYIDALYTKLSHLLNSNAIILDEMPNDKCRSSHPPAQPTLSTHGNASDGKDTDNSITKQQALQARANALVRSMQQHQNSHVIETRKISPQIEAVLRDLTRLTTSVNKIVHARSQLEQKFEVLMDDNLSAERKVLDGYDKGTFDNYQSDSETYVDLVKAIRASYNALKDRKNKLDRWERENT